MDEKIALIDTHKGTWGLNACCRALGVSKGTWHYRVHPADDGSRDASLREVIREAIREHPAYGYRRLKPEIEARTGEVINAKRLRRVLTEWELALPRQVPRPRPSAPRRLLERGAGELNLVAGRDVGPLEMLSTDFTELRYANGTKRAHLMAMIDPASEWVPGWALGPSANCALALECWQAVVEAFGGIGRSLAGVIVHQDQDPVFTSYDWLRAVLVEAQARISYSERGAKDNPWIESFWSRFKGENGSLIADAETIPELQEVTAGQIHYYNHDRRHSSIDYETPMTFLMEFLKTERGTRADS